MNELENIIYELSGEKFTDLNTNIFENRNISNKIWIQIFLSFENTFNINLNDLFDAVSLISINNINDYVYRQNDMRKIKVAFIDDGINKDIIKKLYGNIEIKKVNLTHKKTIGANKLSHATMCALILLDHFIDIEILDIVAFTTAEDTKIDIIKKSLNACLMEKIDILCLSIGNSSNKIGKQLHHIIAKLRENNTIIIAANNNTDEITFPAAFDEVLGIKHDKSMMIPNGNYAYIPKPLDDINIYTTIPLNTTGTNYIVTQDEKFRLDSNSFASSIYCFFNFKMVN